MRDTGGVDLAAGSAFETSLGVGSKTQVTAGDTGTGQFAATTDQAVATTVTVRPASGGGGGGNEGAAAYYYNLIAS